MAGVFKMPKLTLKQQNHQTCPGIPQFKWGDATIVDELASGAFGSVYLANHFSKVVVIKKLRELDQESKKTFLKEASLLQQLREKQNRTIAEFFGLCTDPYAIMMEYVYFDFNPFGIDKKVSSLRDLLVFIDEQQLADTFSNFQVRIAQDIAHGLAFLHDNDIAHRDLKPDNILVANEYYAQLTNEDERCKIFSECPIKAKLADFGESRATHLQTQTLVRSRTSRIDRGTPVYMPPEVHLKQNTESTIEDMKNADVWSFGMTLHCLINPGIDHPYSYNCSEIGRKLTLKTLIEYVKDEKLPKHEPKYEYLRVLEWWQINEVLLACLSFDSNCRPSASEMETLLSASQSYDASLTFYPLSVSQSTALEEADKKLAQKIGSIFKEPQLQHVATPENDGTNACAFIALAICN